MTWRRECWNQQRIATKKKVSKEKAPLSPRNKMEQETGAGWGVGGISQRPQNVHWKLNSKKNDKFTGCPHSNRIYWDSPFNPIYPTDIQDICGAFLGCSNLLSRIFNFLYIVLGIFEYPRITPRISRKAEIGIFLRYPGYHGDIPISALRVIWRVIHGYLLDIQDIYRTFLGY